MRRRSIRRRLPCTEQRFPKMANFGPPCIQPNQSTRGLLVYFVALHISGPAIPPKLQCTQCGLDGMPIIHKWPLALKSPATQSTLQHAGHDVRFPSVGFVCRHLCVQSNHSLTWPPETRRMCQNDYQCNGESGVILQLHTRQNANDAHMIRLSQTVSNQNTIALYSAHTVNYGRMP